MPMRMVPESPVLAPASRGMPQSGATRGNSTNSSTMTGAPNSAKRPARPAACAKLGWPTGMCASTTAASRPQTETIIAVAMAIDCE